MTVRVDVNSKLSNTQAFTEAIKAADRRMSLLRPGSLQAAVAAEKAKLEALDPRFEAIVSTTGSNLHYELKPRCEIHGTLRFEGPPDSVKRCFADFMDRGVPVRPEEYGVTLKAHGSPLMDRENISELSYTRSNDGSIRITHIRGDGAAGATLEIQGRFNGGDVENRFEPTIEPTTFSISATSGCKPDGGVRCAFNVKYDLKPWLGKPLMLLEYFDQLYEVFGSMDENSSMKIELFIKGNRLGGGVVSSKEISQLGPYVGTIYWIDRLRAVERVLKCGLVIPESLPEDWATSVDFAHQLVIGGVVETKIAKLDFTAQMPRESYEQHVTPSLGVVDTLRMDLPEFKRDLLGSSIDLGPVELIAPGTRLSVVGVEETPSSPNKLTVQCQAEIDGLVTIRRRDET